eukprot:NODE_605_length_6197_cov_0.280092.p1 type:complete len:559 gc:universal NODE_605_length_6197_cov_0.280092:5738-4062(-)
MCLIFFKCLRNSNKYGFCRVCNNNLKIEEKCHTCESYQSTTFVNFVYNFGDMLAFYRVAQVNFLFQNNLESKSFYDYLLYFHYISYKSVSNINVVPRILNIFGRASLPNSVYIPKVYLKEYIQFLVKYINQMCTRMKESSWQIQGAILSLNQFYLINLQNGIKIPIESFTCTMLEMYLNVKRDYYNHRKKKFNILDFPYILPTSLKFRYLVFETDNTKNIKFYSPQSLTIHRESFISDSRREIKRVKLGRKIRIEFVNEEGIDAGGMVREWSTLVCDYLAPFCIESDWISESADVHNMELMGVIFGLSVFNGTVLNTSLPEQFFKLVLGLKITDSDYTKLFPQEMKSLKQLLSCKNNPNFDSIFGCMSFCRNYKNLPSSNKDHSHCYPLVKNGHEIYLSKHNVEEYIEAYKQSLLYSMNPEGFKAFLKSFWQILPSRRYVNNLFSSLELKLIIQGDEKFDLTPLRDFCIFDYSMYNIKQMNPKYPLQKFIQDFWDILLNEFTIEQKKRFLRFTTGCDKICSARFCNLKDYDKRGFYFRVSISGLDSEHLPIAHTCNKI